MCGVRVHWFIARVTIVANLFYVIGASGAGKDSLIRYLQEKLQADASLRFARRYITRAADAGGENHVALSTEAFMRRQASAGFAMSWFSHETYYGIGAEIDTWLAQGVDVVLNGSRGYLAQAAHRYPNLVPVLISVRRDVLYARLRERGRETEDEIDRRLIQAGQLDKDVRHARLLTIENNGRLSDAGERLLNAIRNRVNNACV